jgi:hypothetical protein
MQSKEKANGCYIPEPIVYASSNTCYSAGTQPTTKDSLAVGEIRNTATRFAARSDNYHHTKLE